MLHVPDLYLSLPTKGKSEIKRGCLKIRRLKYFLNARLRKKLKTKSFKVNFPVLIVLGFF